jgi:beta-N-acetylhexosaminidase
MTALGPLIVGIDGTELDDETRQLLMHPAVGGVILFSRNFQTESQLRELTAAIAGLRQPRLLVTVDQEGGRVQRFRSGFTPLPPLGMMGRWFRSHPDRACDLAYRHGRVMAAEVLDLGVDLSWAPVLDLDCGSSVIGNRAFSNDAEAVCRLGAHYIAGMRDAGMAACAKHFPGHGSVQADSHLEVVVDQRPESELEVDLQPFARLANQFQAVMMAHVCYPAVDARPAGFSEQWIGRCLRDGLGFSGLVVSDDLDMAGAAPAGGLTERLVQAFAAGCDLALVCKPDSVRRVLESIRDWPGPDQAALQAMYGRPMASMAEQLTVPEFRAWRESLKALS